MTHNPESTIGNGNGRGRWYDSTLVIWGLFSVVGGLLTVLAMAGWSAASEACRVNTSQEVRIERLQATIEAFSARQANIETKLDRLYEKQEEILRKMPR